MKKWDGFESSIVEGQLVLCFTTKIQAGCLKLKMSFKETMCYENL